jgi:hypothetical protein
LYPAVVFSWIPLMFVLTFLHRLSFRMKQRFPHCDFSTDTQYIVKLTSAVTKLSCYVLFLRCCETVSLWNCWRQRTHCTTAVWCVSEYGAEVECYWEGKTEGLGEKPVPVLHCPLKKSQSLCGWMPVTYCLRYARPKELGPCIVVILEKLTVTLLVKLLCLCGTRGSICVLTRVCSVSGTSLYKVIHQHGVLCNYFLSRILCTVESSQHSVERPRRLVFACVCARARVCVWR